MRMTFAAACLAAVALAPIASAQQTCEQQQNQRVAGTLAGGGIGAIIGGSVAGKGAKTEGAILGAIVGGVIGNQAAKPRDDCAHAYGFYDTNGRWHANAVDRNNASGFYGARGEWVDGPPHGHYVDNRWENAESDGYYDADGRWVPPGVDGYYGPDNRWIAVDSSDRNRAYDRDNGDPHDVVARIDRIRDRVNRREDSGALSRRDARNLRDRLQSIADRQVHMPHSGGHLYPADEDAIQRQLDDVSQDARRLARQ